MLSKKIYILFLLCACLGLWWGCEPKETTDVVPPDWQEFVIRNDAYTLQQGQGHYLALLNNDSLVSFEDLNISIKQPPRHGKVTLRDSMQTLLFYYEPEREFYGIDTFSYEVCELKSNKCQIGKVIIEVLPDAEECKLTEPQSRYFLANMGKEIRIPIEDSLGIKSCSYEVLKIDSLWIGDYVQNPAAVRISGGNMVYQVPNSFSNYPEQIQQIYINYTVCDNKGTCFKGYIRLSIFPPSSCDVGIKNYSPTLKKLEWKAQQDSIWQHDSSYVVAKKELVSSMADMGICEQQAEYMRVTHAKVTDSTAVPHYLNVHLEEKRKIVLYYIFPKQFRGKLNAYYSFYFINSEVKFYYHDSPLELTITD